jgi:hypothetical protein
MKTKFNLRTVNVTRYISLCAKAVLLLWPMMILNTSSNSKAPVTVALIAELIGGIARVLKLQIPELVYANLDEAFGRTEADEEIKIYCKGAKV